MGSYSIINFSSCDFSWEGVDTLLKQLQTLQRAYQGYILKENHNGSAVARFYGRDRNKDKLLDIL